MRRNGEFWSVMTGTNKLNGIPAKDAASHRQWLRTQFLAGESALAEAQELELLLSFAIPRKDVEALAQHLISTFGSLDGVLSAEAERLFQVSGLGESSVCLIKLVGSARRHANQGKITKEAPLVAIQNQSRGPKLQDQRELFPAALTSDARGRKSGSPSLRPRKTIQDVLLSEGLLAARLALGVKSLRELQEKLIGQLSQNSIETRRRYAQSVVRWFFPDSVHGVVTRTWATYNDETITNDILRYLYLANEPVMGFCVSEAIFPLEAGISIPPMYFDRFLVEFFKCEPPDKTRERLKQNLKKVGFLERAKGRPDRLSNVTSQKISLIILLHHLFAANSIRTIEIRQLLADPFWKYLGYKSEDVVRVVLREADVAGLFGKYVVADQLEQVTTCFTLDELLERKARL